MMNKKVAHLTAKIKDGQHRNRRHTLSILDCVNHTSVPCSCAGNTIVLLLARLGLEASPWLTYDHKFRGHLFLKLTNFSTLGLRGNVATSRDRLARNLWCLGLGIKDIDFATIGWTALEV